MTERKQLKKKLSKLKHFKANLPMLIDCSNVYGDDYYSKDVICLKWINRLKRR